MVLIGNEATELADNEIKSSLSPNNLVHPMGKNTSTFTFSLVSSDVCLVSNEQGLGIDYCASTR